MQSYLQLISLLTSGNSNKATCLFQNIFLSFLTLTFFLKEERTQLSVFLILVVIFFFSDRIIFLFFGNAWKVRDQIKGSFLFKRLQTQDYLFSGL